MGQLRWQTLSGAAPGAQPRPDRAPPAQGVLAIDYELGAISGLLTGLVGISYNAQVRHASGPQRYDAFGVFRAAFRELEWETPIFCGRARGQKTPNAS